MKRRDFLRGVVASSAAGVLADSWGATTQPNPARPHVLVIHTDQHRIDCLGAYGNAQIKTPRIDALAADGVRFNNSFCPYPVCTPSRFSLLTGLYVHQHRGWTNHCTLPPGTPTLPGLLRKAGYKTKAIGKMHFTPTYLDAGFEEMELCEQDGPGRWDDDYHRELMRLGLVDVNDLEDQRQEYRKNAPKEYWEKFGAMASNLEEKHHTTTWIGDRAVQSLEKWDEAAPRMLMVGFVKPHHPFDPPVPWDTMYDPEKMTILSGWTEENLPRDLAHSKGYFPHKDLTRPAVRRVTAYYYATISQIDHHVGRMIDVLKKKGLYRRSLIVFTSDHGEYMGFHHLLLKGNCMYDPLVKVPLIVKFPGELGAGGVSEELVNTVDVAPTVLKPAGVKPGKDMSGLDLASLREGGGREIVFCESSGGKEVMARSRTRKLILRTHGKTGENLFFDLEKDPLELSNLYEDPSRKDEVARLTRAVEDWRPARDLPETYLDEDARQINQPNVPSRDRSHRREIIEYYDRKMKAAKR